MPSTPLWVPILVGVIGLIGTAGGTIAGTLITQRRADARETEVWTREQERQREEYLREDALRAFDQRRDAYVAFYLALHMYAEAIEDYKKDNSELRNAVLDAAIEMPRKLAVVSIYDIGRAKQLAVRAVNKHNDWLREVENDGTDGRKQEEAGQAEQDFLTEIRRQLGSRSLPPSAG